MRAASLAVHRRDRCDAFQRVGGKRYNSFMAKSPGYTPEHAAAGLDAKFPEIETWPNQFPGYEIVVDDPDGNQLYFNYPHEHGASGS